jgi:hypothetical protein
MYNEANFQISKFMNQQNLPHQLHQKALHSARVTVWCGILYFKITGQYFFKDNNEIVIMVTPACKVHVTETTITQELTQFPQLNKNTQFQQAGVTSHIARNSINTISWSPIMFYPGMAAFLAQQGCLICQPETFSCRAT